MTPTNNWDVLVLRHPAGGYGWILTPRHPVWLPSQARGRASTEQDAFAAAERLAQRCVDALARDPRSAGNVRFHMVETFYDKPVGGAASVPRLSVGQTPERTAKDRREALRARSLDWQSRGGRQTFVALDGHEAESGSRLRELFGCMGALGEQVTMACGAARDLDDARSLSDSPDAELLRRAWAEHTMHWTLAAGHMFLNVVGRTVAVDPAARAHMTVGNNALKTEFRPEDDTHDDWPTLNKKHANAVRRAATQSAHTAVRDSGALAHRLVTDRRWTTMTDVRGEAFHRWRAQTAGVSTMTRRSARIVNDDGLLPDGTRHDVRGPEGSAAAAAAAGDALDALSDVLAEFDRLLPDLLKAVTATRVHDDMLLTVHGNAASGAPLFVESAKGTGVLLFLVEADKADEYLAAFTPKPTN